MSRRLFLRFHRHLSTVVIFPMMVIMIPTTTTISCYGLVMKRMLSNYKHHNHLLHASSTASDDPTTTFFESPFLESNKDNHDKLLSGFLSSPERYAAALNMTIEEVTKRKTIHKQASEVLHRKLQSTDLNGTEKHTLICENRIKYGRHPFVCHKCWSYKPVCICHLAESSRLTLPEGIKEVIVWTHHREWGLTSNTGCLLPLTLQNTSMLMKGLPDHDRILEETIISSSSSSPSSKNDEAEYLAVVLWPNDDEDDDEQDELSSSPQKGEQVQTITLEDVQVAMKNGRRLILIAVDGTWRNARRMVSKLPPSVPRLDLALDVVFPSSSSSSSQFVSSSESRSTNDDGDVETITQKSILAPLRSKGPSRKGSVIASFDRQVCTAEAVTNALMHLGLSKRNGDYILDITRTKVDLIRRYRGKDLPS